jgi:type I restriction enzyme S subunit
VNVYKKNSIKASDLSGKVELDKSSIDRYRVKRGDVFFTRTSETREEIGIASVLLEDIEDCVFSGFVLRARPITDVLLPEFCKYCFSTYNIRKQIIQSSTLTTRALTNGTSLSKVKVLIPSKPEQQRIVDILDRFDTLVNDLSQGLPAEIEARQQQYEYHRDQLLTF